MHQHTAVFSSPIPRTSSAPPQMDKIVKPATSTTGADSTTPLADTTPAAAPGIEVSSTTLSVSSQQITEQSGNPEDVNMIAQPQMQMHQQAPMYNTTGVPVYNNYMSGFGQAQHVMGRPAVRPPQQGMHNYQKGGYKGSVSHR